MLTPMTLVVVQQASILCFHGLVIGVRMDNGLQIVRQMDVVFVIPDLRLMQTILVVNRVFREHIIQTLLRCVGHVKLENIILIMEEPSVMHVQQEWLTQYFMRGVNPVQPEHITQFQAEHVDHVWMENILQQDKLFAAIVPLVKHPIQLILVVKIVLEEHTTEL
jgi:hypothetical protein